MAHTTTRRALRVPDLTDNPDVVRDITNLASDIDSVMASLVTGALASRPSTGQHDGDVYWATDDTTMGPNGTPWKWDAANGQWRIWAPPVDPVATQGGSRTLGSGAQQAAAGNDARLSDARTPLAHAASHRPGGSDELAHLAASALQVKDTGISGQLRAGRVLTLADFQTLLGLSSPAGLFNLSDATEAVYGGARNLTNKGAVTFGSGVTGAATEAAIFHGGATDALYRADAGAGDPFRITEGSWGCWFKTAKTATDQMLVTKDRTSARSYGIYIAGAAGVLSGYVSLDGAAATLAPGTTVVADDRWHFGVVTYDGSMLRTYLDGRLEASVALAGPIYTGAAPFNIGANSADGSTNTTSPLFGRIDEAFVTSDVLSEDQVRLLYAAKLAHGSPVTPNLVTLNVRRRSKGAALVPADFPASPRRLYNFTGGSSADAGLDGAALATSGSVSNAPGADGSANNGLQFVSSGTGYESATDTGLPALATAVRVVGAWFKTSTQGALQIIATYGTSAAGLALYVHSNNTIVADDGTNNVAGPTVTDGQWHFVVLVQDPNAADGLKWKLYLDGRLVASSTAAIQAITLAGAGGFRIGRDRGTNTNYFNGTIDGVFVCDFVMTLEQINALYCKGSQQLPASPKNEGDHIEAFDATNVYIIGDTLDGQHMIDVRMAA